MGLDAFLRHLHDPSPGFRCFDCLDDAQRLRLSVRVCHELGDPTSTKLLPAAVELLGDAGRPFERLYERHNGLVLYAQPDALRREEWPDYYPAGIRFFPLETWPFETQDAQALVRQVFMEHEPPDWMKRGFAFGEICHSSNYFIVHPPGPTAGQIYYLSHDGWDLYDAPVAEDLHEFLDLIVTDPAAFLNDMGCYTRYSDGHSDVQWVPKVYQAAM